MINPVWILSNFYNVSLLVFGQSPSLSQSVRMRKLSNDGLLTMDKIFEIMTEVKGNQVEVLKIPTDRVRQYFKPNTTYKQMEDYIVKALEHYALYLKRQRNRDSR